jgi:hypothetical protein
VYLNGIPTEPEEATRVKRPYKVRLTKVAQINQIILQRFLEGQQSHDNEVLTAITALVCILYLPFFTLSPALMVAKLISLPQNVVIRMEPSLYVSLTFTHVPSLIPSSLQQIYLQCPELLHGPRDQGHWRRNDPLERVLSVSVISFHFFVSLTLGV